MRHTASGMPAHAPTAHTFTAPRFTPGPWRRCGHRQIASTAGAGLPICEVWFGGVGIEQAAANERLIAAAPEMHQALEAIIADTRLGLGLVRPRTMKLVRDALAKAEGGAA